jgi:hypothetical protein
VTVTIAVITMLVASVSLVAAGYVMGREDDRTRQRAWCDGFSAGLHKADEMWPSVVRRWEMR